MTTHSCSKRTLGERWTVSESWVETWVEDRETKEGLLGRTAAMMDDGVEEEQRAHAARQLGWQKWTRAGVTGPSAVFPALPFPAAFPSSLHVTA